MIIRFKAMPRTLPRPGETPRKIVRRPQNFERRHCSQLDGKFGRYSNSDMFHLVINHFLSTQRGLASLYIDLDPPPPGVTIAKVGRGKCELLEITIDTSQTEPTA